MPGNGGVVQILATPATHTGVQCGHCPVRRLPSRGPRTPASTPRARRAGVGQVAAQLTQAVGRDSAGADETPWPLVGSDVQSPCTGHDGQPVSPGEGGRESHGRTTAGRPHHVAQLADREDRYEASSGSCVPASVVTMGNDITRRVVAHRMSRVVQHRRRRGGARSRGSGSAAPRYEWATVPVVAEVVRDPAPNAWCAARWPRGCAGAVAMACECGRPGHREGGPYLSDPGPEPGDLRSRGRSEQSIDWQACGLPRNARSAVARLEASPPQVEQQLCCSRSGVEVRRAPPRGRVHPSTRATGYPRIRS